MSKNSTVKSCLQHATAVSGQQLHRIGSAKKDQGNVGTQGHQKECAKDSGSYHLLQQVYHSHCKEVLYCSSYFCIFWSCTWWLFPNPDTVGEFSVIHCSLCALQKAISVQTCVRLENAWGASIPRFNILRIATQQLHAKAQFCLLQCTLMQSFPSSWDNGSESLFVCWINREMVTKTVWLSKQ